MQLYKNFYLFALGLPTRDLSAQKLTVSTNHFVVDIHRGTCGRKVQQYVLLWEISEVWPPWPTGLAPWTGRGSWRTWRLR